MPSHWVMGVLAAQLSVAVPVRVSRAASSVAQSDTRPGLFPGSGTAPPLAQALAVAETTLGLPGPAEKPIKSATADAVRVEATSLPSFMPFPLG